MKLTPSQAGEVFDLILENGFHHREADAAYRRDFVVRFGSFVPMEHWYRDIKDRPVRVISDMGGLEQSINVYPDYSPSPTEQMAFHELNLKLDKFLENI
ncbi:MAG: hypothetical protein H9W81_09910 [Enterococcus sp.]|nr:hypothetical protein [Enterococcus sp.]